MNGMIRYQKNKRPRQFIDVMSWIKVLLLIATQFQQIEVLLCQKEAIQKPKISILSRHREHTQPIGKTVVSTVPSSVENILLTSISL